MSEVDESRRAALRAVGGLAAATSGLLMGCGGGGDAVDEGLAGAQSLGPTQAAEQSRRTQLYGVTDIGSLGGSVRGVPEGLNDHGDVVGWSETPTSQLAHAFLYHRGTMTDLGTLGDGYSVAHGVNDRRQVVGEFAVGGPSHAFLHTGGVMQDLGTLGGALSAANGINGHGDVVGSSLLNDGATNHAFVYRHGVMHDLDPLGTYRFSSALRINDKGQIAGAYSAGGGAFLYSNGVYRDLGTLGGTSNFPNAINDSGQIAGQARTPLGSHGSFNVHAVVFRGGALTDLHPSGYTDSTAMGINDDGDIVGTLYAAGGLSNGFLHRDGAWSNLNDLLDTTGAGWTVSDAWRINNDGQIVALGILGDELRMILLTPSSSRIKRPALSAAVGPRAAAQMARRADAALAKGLSHAELVLKGSRADPMI